MFLQAFLTWALDGSQWSASDSECFISRRIHCVKWLAEWTPQTMWGPWKIQFRLRTASAGRSWFRKLRTRRKAIPTVSYECDISVQPHNGLPPSHALSLPATHRHSCFKSLALVPGPAEFSLSFLEKFRVGNSHASTKSRLSTSPLMSGIKNRFFQKMCFKWLTVQASLFCPSIF